MNKQLKNRLTKEQVVRVLERYLSSEIGVTEAMALLKIKRRQFFKLSKQYREHPSQFMVTQPCKPPPTKLSTSIEEKILAALREEKKLIEDDDTPIRFYNYSYVKQQLEKTHGIRVSLPTIISRAKKTIFIKPSQRKLVMIGKC